MTDTTQWTVPADHPVFAGHFPGTPIFPGVMLLDAVLHCIAAATGIALDTYAISTVKFLSPAGPGETLTIRHTVVANGTLRFAVAAGTRAIASGDIVPRPAP